MKIVSSFGNRIKQYREDNNLTLAEIERMTNVPAQTINRYELGQRVPKVDAAAIIANKLNLNPLWLFGYDVEDTDVSSRLFEFTEHEQDVIMEYRNHPDMQPAVDRILGVESDPPKIPDLMYDDYELSSTIQKAAQTPAPYTLEDSKDVTSKK